MAAQIRQYFVQFNASMTPSVGCHYHNASHYDMTCDHLSNPRGATLKALLINSGEPMSQYDNQNLNTIQASMILTSVPNYYQVILALITPSFLQGFGRVSLRNILPYPGIEEILHLHVVESEIYPYQELIYTMAVNSTSRPFKVTIVWMDPDNAYLSTRMLLNNLDLKVLSPNGEMFYGNNFAGDEVNNVSAPLLVGANTHDDLRLNKFQFHIQPLEVIQSLLPPSILLDPVNHFLLLPPVHCCHSFHKQLQLPTQSITIHRIVQGHKEELS